MSETDWYFAGCSIGDPDRSFIAAVNTVVGLLRPHGGELWPALIQTARSLIDRSRAIRVFRALRSKSHPLQPWPVHSSRRFSTNSNPKGDGSRLEVKQSAAHQTWSEPRSIQTRGAFDIAARTGYFSEGGSKWEATPGRCAQIYVFAWNPIYGEATDHRDPGQWEFYVVPATALPEGQKTIALSKIKRISQLVKIGELPRHIESSGSL